jgi:hypothetical protein
LIWILGRWVYRSGSGSLSGYFVEIVTLIPILRKAVFEDAWTFFLDYQINMLKGQCHEIFDPQFFHQSIPLGHWLTPKNIFAFGFDFAELLRIYGDSTLCFIAQSRDSAL